MSTDRDIAAEGSWVGVEILPTMKCEACGYEAAGGLIVMMGEFQSAPLCPKCLIDALNAAVPKMREKGGA